MNDFDNYIDTYFSSLRSCPLSAGMLYAIQGGKHVRPRLLFAILKGFGYDENYGYPAALALEMIHSYSLVHDDLPCMDNDDFRRGKASVHKAFGEDVAVLVGDGLLTHAFGVLADSPYEADIRCQMISELSSLAGMNGMLYGQYLDITHNNEDLFNEETLTEIEDYKTGALFECALFLAMYLVKDEVHTGFYAALARKIGRIFQLQDDLFDVTRSTQETGKTASDQRNKKATAFTIYHQNELEEKIAELFDSVAEDLQNIHFDATYLKQFLVDLKGR